MTSVPSALHLARGFDIDPFASFTLPNEHYIDNQLFDREMEAVFARTWQYVCHSSALPNAGDYRVRDLGRRSALVVRDKDGTLQAFHNVCQHRAHRLVDVEPAGQVQRGRDAGHGTSMDQLEGQ